MTPFDPNAICPKCGCVDVATEYEGASAHKDCPFYGQNWIIAQNVSPLAWGTDFYGRAVFNQAEMRDHYRERMKAEEHFDRRCPRCRFAWIEAMPEKVPA